MTFEVQPIPNASDKPSVSQSQIKQNFENLKSWAAVDHLTYGVTNNGTHTKMSIISPSTPTVPVLQESVTFTKLGIADTGSTNLHFQNKNATFQLNPIRAWAYIQNESNVSLSIDMYHIGLIFFRKEQTKQNFILKY